MSRKRFYNFTDNITEAITIHQVFTKACFVNNLLVIGLIKTYGILFVQFLRKFQASTSATSVILGVKSAAFSLSAMLALNILVTRMSIRKLSLLGATLTSAGMLLSVFAKNVAFVVFSQGFLTGLRNAFVFGPGIYLLGHYFDKKRPLAISIANAGVSIGLMVLPPLITYLFEEYTFQGALLLFSGVIMQTVVCASLFRPLRPLDKQVKGKEDEESVCSRGNNAEISEKITIAVDGPNGSKEDQLELGTVDPTNTVPEKEACDESESFISKPSPADPLPVTTKRRSAQWASTCFSPLRFITSVDLSLFKNPVFIIILSFSFFGFIGNELCAAFIPPLAKEKGLTDMQTAELFTIAAALDLFSRLLPGILAHFGLMTRPKMTATAFIVMGVTFQFTAYYNSYSLMVAFIVVYGSFAGFFFSLLPVIIIDLIGLEKFPKAFGFVLVFQGIAGAAVYPLLGTFRDVTGSYAATFHFLGATLLLASAILMIEPVLRRSDARKKRPSEPDVQD